MADAINITMGSTKLLKKRTMIKGLRAPPTRKK